MNFSRKFWLTLTLPAVLAACSTAQKEAPAVPVVTAAPAPAPQAPAPAPAVQAAPESRVTSVVLPDHLDPKSAVASQRSIYFDYDTFAIRQQDQPVVELQGKYLAKASAVKVRVEGNADERGSTEYNLALGQKRAEAVVRGLKVFGAKDDQMEAVSYGEEKPKAAGHDEAAWAQNRRVDIVYPGK